MTSHAAPNWSRIARDVIGEYLKWFAAIWLIGIVVTSAIIAAVAYFGTPSTSMVDVVLNSPRYWIFVIGLIFTYQRLGPYVACGVTRRDVAIGGAAAGLVGSLAAGVMCTVTVFAEGQFYTAMGWTMDYEAPHLFSAPDQWGPMLVEFCLVFTTHYFAGWAMGTMFYRYGPWAIVVAVPTFGAAVGTEVVLGSGWAGRLVLDNIYDFTPSWSLSLAVGTGVIALLCGLVWLLLRDVAIQPKKS